MLLLLASAAFARLPDTITYARPDDADASAIERYAFTTYAAGDKLWVVGPNTNLYAEANDASAKGWLLVEGTKVEVLAVGADRALHDGAVNLWYQVQAGERTGWVHGSRLSPFGWPMDVDQDGEIEFVGVGFTADFAARVVVVEPNPRAGATTYLDLATVGGAYLSQRGSDIRVDVLRSVQAGIPLVHVYTGVEACADFRDYWVSYRSRGPSEIGMLRVAMEQSGLNDPPSSSTYEVKFDGKRKIADVKRTTEEGEDQPPTVRETRYVLVDGEFKVEKGGKVQR